MANTMSPLVALTTLLLSAGRPSLLDGECQLYSGLLWGNDPSVTTSLHLCRQADAICGTLVWESTQSGRNVRELSGAVDGNRLILRDERFAESSPKPGWMFCLIDRYTLEPEHNGNGLRGSYSSTECRDQARLRLRRAPTPKEPPASCFIRPRESS
jgi:hypothetical protein